MILSPFITTPQPYPSPTNVRVKMGQSKLPRDILFIIWSMLDYPKETDVMRQVKLIPRPVAIRYLIHLEGIPRVVR